MTYTPRYRSYAHQLEANDRMRGRREFALLMGMRTGKTKVTIDDWGEMVAAGELRDLAVIAPGGVYRTWTRALEDHLDPSLKERILTHVWDSGVQSTAERNRLSAFLGNTDRRCARVLLANVEAVSSVTRMREAMTEFLRPGAAALVVDESTVIKRWNSKRTRFINEQFAPLALYRRILSGLPTPKSPLDLYSQFEFLNWRILGFRSFFPFRARYSEIARLPFGEPFLNQKTQQMERRKVQVVKDYRNIEELWEKIAPHSFRRTLADCYDVPKTMYIRREVPLTPDQERVYRDLKQFCTAALSANVHVTATLVISQMLRMHQVLMGHVRDEEGQMHEVPERRTDELLQVLNEYDGKAIIWCCYDDSVRRVATRLEKEFGEGTVARFWGGNRATREDEEQRFKNDPNCTYMVATQSAGGKGRTWDVADLMVYYGSTNDLDHRMQSEERTSGYGKARPTTIVDLVAPDTVEEKILYALREKLDLASLVTNDNWRSWVV